MKQYILYVHAHVHVHAVDLYLAGDDVKKGSVCCRKQSYVTVCRTILHT